jgi:hypothetical protein
MAEIYQNPSGFQSAYPLPSGVSLAPPQSLIPDAPAGQNDALTLLMSLMQILPQDVVTPMLSDALAGKISIADIVQRLISQPNSQNSNPAYRQGDTSGLQGSFTQPGLTNNTNIPNAPPSQYTTTAQPLAPTAPAAPNTNTTLSNGQRQPLFSYNNPFYSSVTSPVLNEQGREIGQTNLANNQFATPGMANSLLNYLSSTYGLNNGRIVTGQYSGPTRPSQDELGIQFGNSPTINAGLEYQRLQNTNNYSRPYLDAQFQDTLKPGSSGWNNYVNTGGQSINSAQAERLYAGNPNTDPNVNPLGQQWKLNQTNGAFGGTNYQSPQQQQQNSNFGGPAALPNSNNSWRSLPGNTTITGYAGAQNQREANFNNPMNFRGGGRF